MPSCDTEPECMMLCEKSFRPFSKRSERMSRFTATLAYTRSFCEFVGAWTVNIFSSVNHVLANLATVSRRDRCLQDEVLTACWDEISQDTINRAIGQFRKRLSLVIAAYGGHRPTKHYFD